MSFSALKDKRNARMNPMQGNAANKSASTSTSVPISRPASASTPTSTSAAAATAPVEVTTRLQIKEKDGPLSTASSQERHYTDFPEEILQIRTTAQSGRGIYVRSDIEESLKAGTTIISTLPTEAALSTSQLDEYCSFCFLGVHELQFLPSSQRDGRAVLFACGGCRVARYCSRTCQSLAWTTHKQECQALQRLCRLYLHHQSSQSESETESGTSNRSVTATTTQTRGKERPWVPEESVRALGRICWARRRKSRELKQKSEVGQWWSEIEGLQSHRESLSTEQRQPFAQLAMTLAQYLAAGEPSAQEEEHDLKAVDMRDFGFAGVGEMMDLVCAFATNSFTLSTPSLTPIGVSISPLIALINHSCVPNAVVVFPFGCARAGVGLGGRHVQADGKGMRVVLIRDVQPGEEIVTSYIDVSLPRHIRQKDLSQRYHFTCSCSLCERYAPRTMETGKRKARVVDPRWCMFHPACEKNGVLALPSLSTHQGGDLACSACGKTAHVQLERVNGFVALGTQIVQSDERGQLSVDEAKDIPALAEKLSALLPATSYPLLPLLRLYALQLTQPASSTAVVQTSASVEQGLGHNLFPAIRIQSILVHALRAVLPDNHPSLGITLAELGKLLNVHVDESALSTPGGSPVDLGNGFLIPRATSKRLPLALSTLRRAWEALQIGFGKENGVEGGVVAWEVKVLVEGLEREMQMRRGVYQGR